MEKYNEKMSSKAKLIHFLIRISNIRKKDQSVENTQKFINKYQNKKNNLPDKMHLNFEDGFSIPIYTSNGNLTNPKDKILLYIHGGSYTQEACKSQIIFAKKLAQKTDSTLVMPIYTLAPNGNYKKMYKDINELYVKLLSLKKEINFLGDSAGGGFCLSYAMYLRDNEIKNAKNILLSSPWLDLTLTNEEINEYSHLDYFVGVPGNKYNGELWSNNNPQNWLVSPIYGNFENIGKISIVVGEKDLLKPDCKKMINKLKELNIEYNYFELKGQYHNCGVFPTKEGNHIIDEFATIINNNI